MELLIRYQCLEGKHGACPVACNQPDECHRCMCHCHEEEGE